MLHYEKCSNGEERGRQPQQPKDDKLEAPVVRVQVAVPRAGKQRASTEVESDGNDAKHKKCLEKREQPEFREIAFHEA